MESRGLALWRGGLGAARVPQAGNDPPAFRGVRRWTLTEGERAYPCLRHALDRCPVFRGDMLQPGLHLDPRWLDPRPDNLHRGGMKSVEELGPARRVLSVDSEPMFAELLSALLTEAGYELASTTSREEALLTLRAHTVDLLLLALHPDIEELLLQLKNDPALRQIPVILVTGHSKEASASILRKRGLDIERDVVGYLHKGEAFPDKLLEAIELAVTKCGRPVPPEHGFARDRLACLSAKAQTKA